MQVSEKQNKFMHSRLPIDADEKILAIYKHHWFAYASLWIVSLFLVAIIFGLAIGFSMAGNNNGGTSNNSLIFGIAGAAAIVTLFFTLIPIYLRSQEQVVLTEEAVLQILQPSLFASKISQLNLAHIADVSVRQDFFGTVLGYGKITVETPGEQDNYEFTMIPRPQTSAKEIIAAHENFQAAVESGRIPTTLGTPQPAAPQIDPQQYEQFLQYQQMVAKEQQDAAAQNTPAQPAASTEAEPKSTGNDEQPPKQ